jgi:hypothetical protein
MAGQGYIEKLTLLKDRFSNWNVNPFIHIKRVVVYFIQNLLSNDNPIGLRYNQDPKITDILISDGGFINTESFNKKPAIVVARDNARLAVTTINSLYSHSFSGAIKKEEMLTFTIVINVLSLNQSQVEEIVWFVASHIWFHNEFLAKEGFFSVGTDIAMTPPGSPIGVVEGDPGGYYLSRLIIPARAPVVMVGNPINYDKFKDLKANLGPGEMDIKVDP